MKRSKVPTPTPVDKRALLIILVVLIIATFAAYAHVTQNDFVLYDDPDYVKDNPNIKLGVANAATWGFSIDFLKDGGRAYAANYHPLTWISHAVDYDIYKLNAGGHHATNVIFHVLSTVLLFLALSKMTGSIWKSGFVAALFALHPLHVESVAWVAERKDVLSTFFWMLTMLAYAFYVSEQGSKRRLFYACVVASFVLGLLAKPMLVTLPFALLMLDFWPLRRLAPERKPNTSLSMLFVEKLPLFALTVASSVITFLAQRSGGAVNQLEDLPMAARVANSIVACAAYIGKMIWPAKLAVFYPLSPPGQSQPVVICLLVLVAITAFVIRFRHNRGYLTVGWVWYLFTLIPVIGLVQVGEQSMADRYTYIPLVGLFIMIAWLIPDIFSTKREVARGAKGTETVTVTPPWIAPAAIIVLAACFALTYQQVTYWRTSETLFRHAIQVNPNNYLAYTHLGGYYDLREDYGKAEQAVRAALEIKPGYTRAHNALGNILSRTGRLDEALEHYEQAINISTNDPVAVNNLAIIYGKKGQYDKACEMFRRAIDMNPSFKNAYSNLGYALTLAGKPDEAIGVYQQALEIDPFYDTAHSNLGGLLMSMKRYDEALTHLLTAVDLNPKNPEAYVNLIGCYEALGRKQEAQATIAKAAQNGIKLR